MKQSKLNWSTGYIWGIAADVLRDLYVRGKYRDVILPMTVLRRLDAQPQPMRTLEEIRTDILALEQETEGLLGEIVGDRAKDTGMKRRL